MLGITLGVISVLLLSYAKKADSILKTFKLLINSILSVGTLVGLYPDYF